MSYKCQSNKIPNFLVIESGAEAGRKGGLATKDTHAVQRGAKCVSRASQAVFLPFPIGLEVEGLL